MKGQSLFSGKKNVTNLSSVEFFQRVMKINIGRKNQHNSRNFTAILLKINIDPYYMYKTTLTPYHTYLNFCMLGNFGRIFCHLWIFI